ncbi:MAG: hypothetical protein ABFS45_10835 [Pseudomonadota bacterium]
MCIIDDPLLALIARFVVEDINDLSISDEIFLQHQVSEIRSFIENAPREQQQQLALAWIEEHAERYRQEWQRRTFSRIALGKRCADCPLIHDSSKYFCIIHSRWVVLLKEYIADEIGSDKYIEEALNLLNQHKTNLKISAISSRM